MSESITSRVSRITTRVIDSERGGSIKPDGSTLRGLWHGYKDDDKTGWLIRVNEVRHIKQDYVDYTKMGASIKQYAVNVFVTLEAECLEWPGDSPFPYAIVFTPRTLIPHPMNPLARGLRIHINGYKWEACMYSHYNKPATMEIKGQVSSEKHFTALQYV